MTPLNISLVLAGVSVKTLYLMIKAKKLRAVRAGRRVLVERNEIERITGVSIAEES